MSWYRVDSLLELFTVSADYPDGIVSLGPRHLLRFHLQEVMLDPDCYAKWKLYARVQRDKSYISLFTDYNSSLTGGAFDKLHACAGCGLPLLDHPTGATMETSLFDRMAFALRALVNAKDQSRTVSSDTMKIARGALNEYEAGKAQDAEDADTVLQRLGDDRGKET